MGFCNFLSALRGPLALCFLREEPWFRVLGIVIAMLTDVLDGYLARRFRCTSQFGAFLDPLMDRIFVAIGLSVLVHESRLDFAQVFAMLSRDMAIFLFGFYLLLSGNWARCRLQALWCGKATTALQFLVLMSVVIGVPVAPEAYTLFSILGAFALLELILINRYSVA